MSATGSANSPVRRFSLWKVVVWMLLLFASLGAVQYLQHAEYLYLIASLVVIAICAAGILRLAWSRVAMQAMAWLLALWTLVTAVLMMLHWGDFDVARQHAQSQPQLRELALFMIARAQRTWQIGLALKLVAIPVLCWLAWQMGRPSMRSQFLPGRH